MHAWYESPHDLSQGDGTNSTTAHMHHHLLTGEPPRHTDTAHCNGTPHAYAARLQSEIPGNRPSRAAYTRAARRSGGGNRIA